MLAFLFVEQKKEKKNFKKSSQREVTYNHRHHNQWFTERFFICDMFGSPRCYMIHGCSTIIYKTNKKTRFITSRTFLVILLKSISRNFKIKKKKNQKFQLRKLYWDSVNDKIASKFGTLLRSLTLLYNAEMFD